MSDTTEYETRDQHFVRRRMIAADIRDAIRHLNYASDALERVKVLAYPLNGKTWSAEHEGMLNSDLIAQDEDPRVNMKGAYAALAVARERFDKIASGR
jgi:hypothetical protein